MKAFSYRILIVLLSSWHAATVSAADARTEIPVFIPVEQGANRMPLPPQPIVPAMIGLLATESGLGLVTRPLPWRRAQLMAKHGDGLLYGAAVTPERLRHFRFTKPLDRVNQWLVSSTTAPLAFNDWDDLRGKTISILPGAQYGVEFESRRGVLFRVEQNSPTIDTRLQMLRAGRVDGVMIASYLDAERLEAKLNCMFPGATALKIVGRPVDKEALLIAVPRAPQYDSSFAVLNKAIERLVDSGRLQELRQLHPPASACD